jgi:hypothetical protein
MNIRAKQERQKRKEARIKQAKILSGAKPAPSREEIVKQTVNGFEAAIANVRELLFLAERILARQRYHGFVEGLKSR